MFNTHHLLSKAVLDSCFKALKANLTTDTFEIIIEDQNEDWKFLHQVQSLSSYFLISLDNGVIYKDDIEDFRRNTDLENIRHFFASSLGKEIHWSLHRRLIQNDYRWTVMEIVAAEDFSLENMNVYLTVKDVHSSFLNAESSLYDVYRALCDNFDSIYYIDLNKDTILPYRTNNHNNLRWDELLKKHICYSELADKYVNASVMPEDRNNVSHLMDESFIREHLAYKNAFSADYRTFYDGQVYWYRMKFARIDQGAEVAHVVLGVTEINDEKRMGNDFFRRGKTILIVEDDDFNRGLLGSILEDDYQILKAENGAVALDLMERNTNDIAVVITDLDMPVCGGFELLMRMRSHHRFNNIPVIVATTNEDIETQELCLEFGAADFISKPYNATVVRNRVKFFIEYRESASILSALERDPLTGLFTKEFFFKRAGQVIRNNKNQRYALLVADIENFKLYNERYGTNAGDELLRAFSQKGNRDVVNLEFAGRIEGDLFASLIRVTSDMKYDYSYLPRNFVAPDTRQSVNLRYGLYFVNEQIPVSTMCDRAILAKESVKESYDRYVAVYDDSIRDNLMRIQQIVNHAGYGLHNNQFRVDYQLRYDLKKKAYSGAEALVRWVHPTLGFMNPGEFIPIFEKNGFISNVDDFVINEVCSLLVEWKLKDIPLIPISINISRRDFELDGFVEKIISTVDSYGLSHSLIHFEITESMYSDNPDLITHAVSVLHDAGFIIELDDFGTGYSSLAALSQLPIDVLKLDITLLKQTIQKTGRSILDFSIQFAHLMNLEIVQEGVETKQEVDRVAALGCHEFQGYYFAKPLTKEDFEKKYLGLD